MYRDVLEMLQVIALAVSAYAFFQRRQVWQFEQSTLVLFDSILLVAGAL